MRSAAIVALGLAALAALALVGYAGVQLVSHAALSYFQAFSHMKLRKPASRDTMEQLDVDVSIAAGSHRAAVPSRAQLEPSIHHAVGKYPNWIAGPRAAPHEKMKLTFMLRHSKEVFAKLEETLYAVSTPGKPRYGQHLTYDEVKALASPVPGAREAVLEWFKVHGVEVTYDSHDAFDVTVSVQTAEAMLGTTMRRFTHRKVTRETRIRAAEPYSVPNEVAFAVATIGGLVRLPALSERPHVKKQKNASTLVQNQPYCNSVWCNDCDACDGFTTPAVLRKAYDLPDDPNGGYVGQTKMAIAQFQGVSWDHSDLQDFRQHCRSINYAIDPAYNDGTNHDGWCANFVTAEICLESLLDVQYSKATGGQIPLTVFSDDDYSLERWAIHIQDPKFADIPLHSVSYGNDEVQQDSPEYIDVTNAQFMQAGIMGKSILFASGDMGVWGRTGNEGDGKFHPDFPGASPYITSVGGTNFVTQSVIGEEESWDSSGGGFSDHSSRPAYQDQAVEAYLQNAASQDGFPSNGAFSPGGRGYPDVSALGGMTNPYCVDTAFLFGTHMMVGVGGTSASSPAVAGMFARINGERQAAGKSVMGFLNPFIYQNPQAFNDVTKGNNNWGEPEGFRALAGWDPATGMGTPKYGALKEAALQASQGAPGVYPNLPTPAPMPAPTPPPAAPTPSTVETVV